MLVRVDSTGTDCTGLSEILALLNVKSFTNLHISCKSFFKKAVLQQSSTINCALKKVEKIVPKHIAIKVQNDSKIGRTSLSTMPCKLES